MTSRPSVRDARRLTRAHISEIKGEPAERRTWLSHGLAALAISGLGLAVAGSISVTTNAQPRDVSQPLPAAARPATGAAGLPLPATGLPAQPAAEKPSVLTQGNLAAFAASTVGGQPPGATLRVAVIHERAAQRTEDLSKAAEAAIRASQDKLSEARQEQLAQSDRAARENAVRIAQERLRRAIAARVAAQVARELAQAESDRASAADTGSRESAPTRAPATVDLSDLPSGGGSAPVPGAVIGATFGQMGSWSRYHTGIDFRAGYGTPIRAVKTGVVTFAGNKGDWAGYHVAIRHAGGMSTMSSHMSSIAVGQGQIVRAGQVIGYVGSTGRSFGAHLHFELYPAGVSPGDVYRAINPLGWLQAAGVRTR